MISALAPGADTSRSNTILTAPISTVSTTSFAQQLASALEQFIGNSQNGSQFELDIQPSSNHSTAGSQFVVTVKAISPATQTAPPTSMQSAGSGTADPVQPISSGTAASDTVQVPFGIGTTTVPSLSKVMAQQEAEMAVMTPAAILNQDRVSAAGDPMAGVTIPGTNFNWDKMTQEQQLAYIYASNYGLPASQNMQDYLNSNFGPHIMANAPCNNPMLFSNG
jgi:hypothetical protein